MPRKPHSIKTPFFDEQGKQKLQEVISTPLSAIKQFCTECFAWEGNPKNCPSITCALWPHRGKSLAYRGPAAREEMSEERKVEVTERLARARDKRSKKAAGKKKATPK